MSAAHPERSTSRLWDCIVWGLGGVGSSAAAHLAARGLRVLGFEQFGPAHDRGSSHGRTRVIRKAYFEHPDYVPLLHRAFDLWRDLEHSTGRTLLRQTGLFLSGPPAGEAVAGTRRAAREHRLPLEDLSPHDISERFPRFIIPDDHAAVFEEQAGVLFVEECVRAALDQAARLGAELRFHEPVRSMEVRGSTVKLTTDAGAYEAAALVVCCGAWSGGLFGEVLPPMRVLRKVQCWQAIDPAAVADWRNSPVFFCEQLQGAFYGFPTFDGRSLKVAEHAGGEVVHDPDNLRRGSTDADFLPVSQFAMRTLRGVLPETVDSSTCMYTMSPDGHFIVDRHPAHPQVVLVAGLSGHGFKFTGVLGEAVSQLVVDGRSQLPIEFLGLSRFH